MTATEPHISDQLSPEEVNFADLVGTKRESLSRAERQVADYLAAHTQDIIFLSAVQIANATNTSDATVIRTAKMLGFSGLPELKHAVGSQLLQTTHPANRLAKKITTMASNEPDKMMEAVVDEAGEQLREMSRVFDSEQFDAAVQAIESAQTVMTFGVGISRVVAEYLSMRLNRIGLRADLASGMGFALADDLLRLREGDALVIIAPGRFVSEVKILMERAKALHIPIVLITDSLHVQIADQVHAHLRAPMSVNKLTGEILAASIVVDALLLALAKKLECRATASYQTLTSLRRKFNNGRSSS